MPRVFSGRVVAAERLTPGMRRLVIGGGDVGAFRMPPGALAPYVKVRLQDGSARPVTRTYTVRRHDPDRGELTVDVVLHGDGPGAALATGAQVGDPISFSGPGFIPAAPCRSYLLAGDHCALPAIASILESLPGSVPARAFIEIPDPAERQDLAVGPETSVTWLLRSPGTPSLLPAAVCAVWRPGDDAGLLVWGGAEATLARSLRHYACAECHVPAERCQVLNYWRHGRPEGRFSYVE